LRIARNLSISLFIMTVVGLAPLAPAQQAGTPPATRASVESASTLPDAPSSAQPGQAALAAPDPALPGAQGQQTKRILGIIPNFRSVSADQKLPPLGRREKFKLMMEDNFDYSSFIYVGILAGISQAQNSYPEFHSGAPAFARYYWHNFADTVDGNLMTEYIFPVATREDPRYYTLGHGGLFKRSGYAITRLLWNRTDSGAQAPNISEIVGNGAASGISDLYYPTQERTWTKTGQRWVTQVGLDGFSNLVKEFWPDVNAKLFHNKY